MLMEDQGGFTDRAIQHPVIYFVNKYGWPDGAATAQILCQALELLPEGLSVVLVQGTGTYAAGQGAAKPPVSIKRLWVPGIVGPRSIQKFVGFLAFYVQASWVLFTRPLASDVVVMTSPPFLNWIGAVSKCVRGGRLVSWEMDVYPEILFSTGWLQEFSWFGRLLARLTLWARHHTDLTIALGPCMARLLEARGVLPSKVRQLQNWAVGDTLYPLVEPGARDRLRLLYSGNLGVAHDVTTTLSAVERVADVPVDFVFAGAGVGMDAVRRLRNAQVTCQQGCSYSELNLVLNAADVGLVTQSLETLGCVVPSKVYGILASGRGVLFVGPEESTVAQVIRETGCGWIVALGDTEGMARLIRELEADRTRVRKAGERARQVFEERFTREKGVARFWELLASLDDKRTN